MRIVAIKEHPIAISRYADPSLPSGGLTTSLVAVSTDAPKLTGYGFGSIGRFAQSGLIRERFAPRLLASPECTDPLEAWAVMMRGEKPGGHGERCVAVGALDMALWDLAAKSAGQPLYRFLATKFGREAAAEVDVYAGGGYYFPGADDLERLRDEAQYFRGLGLHSIKIKIGSAPLRDDIRRIETVLEVVGDGSRLAVDAMNAYDRPQALEACRALAPYHLRWFEDICDPLDFDTHAAAARQYAPPLSAGEALFSKADAQNLLRYGGLRPGHDVLTFDPAHCYGLPEFNRIVDLYEQAGWSRRDFQPHGGHLFGLHIAAGLGLGGCECNPHNFQPVGGFGDGQTIHDGRIAPPEAPGIGFETKSQFYGLLRKTFN